MPNARKWKYADEERSDDKCYDCGLPYERFPTEFIIGHDYWELINPTYHKGAGLLCHNCMIERLIEAQVTDIIPVLHFHVRFKTDSD